jgi:hypothetical protein
MLTRYKSINLMKAQEVRAKALAKLLGAEVNKRIDVILWNPHHLKSASMMKDITRVELIKCIQKELAK